MKIMIIGGSPNPNDAKSNSAYAETCERSMQNLAECLVDNGHDIIVCSPFKGSADHAALQGLAYTRQTARVEFHYPNTPEISEKVEEWVNRLPEVNVDKFPHLPPETDSDEALMHAWLLSQLCALDRASLVISIGGRIGASAELLLKLAHSRGRHILPLTAMDGASARFFDANRYEFDDSLGEDVAVLNQDEDFHRFPALLSKLNSQTNPRSDRDMKVFVSYARAQSSEADFVEMTLRRRGIHVVRDEAAFEPGHSIPGEIRKNIIESQIFISLWSVDYACSPWCFDEIQLALDRLEKGLLSLWIIQLDETRVVPPRARDKLSYPAKNREQLRAVLESLISGRR